MKFVWAWATETNFNYRSEWLFVNQDLPDMTVDAKVMVWAGEDALNYGWEYKTPEPKIIRDMIENRSRDVRVASREISELLGYL